MSTYTHVSEGAHRSQKRASDAQELELQVTENQLMWVAGTGFRSSVRGALAPTAEPSLQP